MILASLAACRAGPDYRPPGLPAGATSPLISMKAVTETSGAPADAWWRLYEDPRLDDLIHEALAANRTLAAAEANFAAAQAIVSAARASRYPSTELSAVGLRGRDATTDEILELGGHPPATIWLLEDLLQSAYEVDLFGRVHRAIEEAKANADAVAAARDGVSIMVVAATARAYAAVCALGEEADVARHSLDVAAHEAEILGRRRQAGASSLYEVTRAQSLVAQVQSDLPGIAGQRQAALFELAALLGRTPAEAPREVEACTTPPRLASPIPVGDGAALLRRRPDVRQAERRLAAATAGLGVTTAELYPTIRLLGLYGGAAPELAQLNTNIGRTWGIGPSISWSFPNMAGPRARVRQAKARQAAALAAFDSAVLTALKETEQALALYHGALERHGLLADARARAEAAFKIAQDQFRAGALSYLEVLTAEHSLNSLDSAVAASDAALVQDQIEVFKALGGGWGSDPTKSG